MLIIREAIPDDAADIARIHISDIENKSVISKIPYTPDSYYPLGGQWMHEDTCREHIIQFTSLGGRIFVAELDGKVVGEIDVIIEDDPLPYGRYLYIYVLMVHKNFRGQGIGRRLIEYAEKYAESKSASSICTFIELNSEPFYRKLGFILSEKWTTIEVFSEMAEIQFDYQEVDAEYFRKSLLEKKYQIVFGRYGGNRSLLYNMTAKYSSLKELKIEYTFFRVKYSNSELLYAIRYSNTISNAVYCWSSEQRNIDIFEAMRTAKILAAHTNIGSFITCVKNKYSEIIKKIVEPVDWYKKTLKSK